MLESFAHTITVNNRRLFHLARLKGKDVLLIFLHGLGDSHLNYASFFENRDFDAFDLIVPDWIGHGKSDWVDSYSFREVSFYLKKQLSPFLKEYQTTILLPHSFGGVCAVDLCHTDLIERISGIFALETSVTQYGSYLAEDLARTIEAGNSFKEWFARFKEQIAHQGEKSKALQLYYQGICRVDPKGFRELGLDGRSIALKDEKLAFSNRSGNAFVRLDLPKLYCVSSNPSQKPSIAFLNAHQIPVVCFPTSSHWVVQNCPELFAHQLKCFTARL